MFTNLFHFRLIYHELGYVKILSLYAANIVRHLNSNNPKPAMKGDLDLVVMEINGWSTNLPSLSFIPIEGPKPATRGGEWEPIKISSEIHTVDLYPENHPSPQAF